MTHISTEDEVVDDTGMLDEQWLAAPTKRSRLRFTLIGLLLASLCFLGGSLTQKHFGADDSSSVAQGIPGGLPAGLPAGFPAGGGGLPTTGDGGAGSASTEDDASDSVIGTVVEIKGETWVVEDLGGKRHEVTVGGSAKVTRETRITANDIKTGDRVQVTGTTKDKQLQADSVTQR